jgi:geranylgeranyl diphosphate synthase type II
VSGNAESAAALARYAGLIEESLAGYIPCCPYPESGVADAMRYSLLGGGKRVRGALVLAFYQLFHEGLEPALPFACAMEMVHAYSLIHDDLPCMDDDDLRRGKPSCHRAFGEATALLAGDALLTLAFEIVADAGLLAALPAEAALRSARCLAHAAGMAGMVGGQAIDLASEGAAVTREQLDRMYRKKTGALIGAAAYIGCALAGAREAETAAALRYAGHIGMAFQIIDDILDVAGDEAVLGKAVGSDRGKDKSTYVSMYGLWEAKREAERLSGIAKESLGGLPGDTGFLRDLADMLTERQN